MLIKILTAKEAFETAKKAILERETKIQEIITGKVVPHIEREIIYNAKKGEMKVEISFATLNNFFETEGIKPLCKNSLFDEIRKYFEPCGYQTVFYRDYTKIEWLAV